MIIKFWASLFYKRIFVLQRERELIQGFQSFRTKSILKINQEKLLNSNITTVQ